MVEFKSLFAERTQVMRASEIRELLKLAEGRDVISLAGGLPDPSTFPVEEFREMTLEVLGEYGPQALQYSPTLGVTPFRKTLREFLLEHGVRIEKEDNLIVTTGSQQALELVARTLIDPGDVVVTEKPTYLAAINAFRVYGARFIGINTDHDGMDTHELEEKLRRLVAEGVKPKFVYMVPTCQNPGGFTMSMERRKHFMELAEQYDLLVVEDDPYSYFTFEPVEFTHLKNLDENSRVLYMGTLSKILAPGLRIGWVVGHSDIISQLELAKQTIDLHTPTLTQYVAMKAIQRGVVDKTIEKARKLYRIKRDKMIESLEKYFPSHARWTKPVGGMFVFVYLREDIDTKALMYKALDYGVAYVPGRSFFVDGSGKNTMRLNYSYPTPEQIEEGIKRLGRMFSQL